MHHRKRSLLVIVVTVLALIFAVLFSGKLSAPEHTNKSQYTDGEIVSMEGEVVCLEHVNQDGPVTMECAYGFMNSSGEYYALQDKTSDYRYVSGTPMNQKVRLNGVYRNAAEEYSKYKQSGLIEIISIE